MNKRAIRIKRGEIYYADLSPVIGSEQGGIRPVMILQNDIGNHYSPTTVVASITGRTGKNDIPTHTRIVCAGLPRASIILLEQLHTIDKSRRQVPMTDEVYDCFQRIIANRKKPKVEPMIDGKIRFLYLDKNEMPMVALH